ncbi:MAG TPA: PEP-CTERM sorting domain-containing protein [Gammaproteobacteria bacterium]|nr:PEP-CTERM sorting domain-containing protein [Gammaproteobacteria bacterium]
MKRFPCAWLPALLTLAGDASALVITPSTDGDLLASLLAGGGGVSIVTGSVLYVGKPEQGGTFSDGLASGIGIDKGVILTTGSAPAAVGPNVSDGTSTTVNSPGDADLTAQIGNDTNDANVLSFRFTTTTGSLFFQYVFASEEYNEFIGSYNDPFALLVDGVNVALAPDGNPVSVDNVNCGNPYSGSGPNCAYFNNNDPTDGGPFFDIEYDGFTDVFTASVTGLTPGEHTMKFVIADAVDAALDSAVFIKAASFTGTPPGAPVPEPTAPALLMSGLGALALRRRLSGRSG